MQSFKSLFGAQDMTQGKPLTNLLKFSIPLLIGNIAQQLYSAADSIIVGRFAPEKQDALAAVGVTMPVINLLLVVLMAIATGAGVMVSQYYGAKDKQRLSGTVGTSLVLVVVSSIAISILGILLAPWILRAIDTSPIYYAMAKDYLVIILIGLAFSGLFNIVSGILRGLGDSVWPLVYLLVAVALNIGLDLWFVIGLRMGVAGAAWATIISQAISAFLCVIRLFKMRDVVELGRHNLKIDKALTAELARLGLPGGVTQGIMSMSMLLVQRLSNQIDDIGGGLVAGVVATSTAVMRVDGFAMLPNFTFGMALATFVGQNVGAGRLDRVAQGTKDGLKLAVSISCALSLLIILFGKQMVGLFVDPADAAAQAIVTLGERAFRILALGYVGMAFWQVFSGIMRGAGDTMPMMWISLTVNVLVRIPVAYILAYFTRSPEWPNGSPDALYFSLLICWCMGALVCYLVYRRGRWKEKSLIRRRDPEQALPIEDSIELD